MVLNYFYMWFIWRLTVRGRFTLGRHDAAVIVCNHRCPLDPSFIARALGRMGHWMVAREYCENPWIGWFFRTCRVIPVGRAGVDTAATKMAIRLASQGGVVGIFPEGRINDTPELMLPGRPGVALIALKARAPVIPCYIQGSPYRGAVWDCLFTFARVTLTIGQPIDLSAYYGREGEREVLEEITRRLLREIAILAGQPEFEPKLAGRFYKPGLADA
jgi:1-acyl-sn-glycerol-3-phosphate acyltransferase